MTNFINITGVYIFGVIVLIRRNFWKIRSKMSSTIRLKLTRDDSFLFKTEGEIAAVLYANQPLIFVNKGFEYKTINKMISIVKSGNNVLDIGANIGMYSLFLSKLVGDSGKIYAFEPDANTARIFRENMVLNNVSNVILNQVAVSDTKCKISLQKPNGSGDAFNYIDTSSDSGTIDAIVIDDYLKENKINKIDFVKIDVEGAELMALKGGGNYLLPELRPVLIMEVYDQWCKRFDNTTYDVLELVGTNNYKIESYEEWQWIAIAN